MRPAGGSAGLQLPQEADQVEHLPVLDEPAVLQTVDVDPRDGDAAAGGGHAREVGAMGPRRAPAGHDAIVLRDLVVHGDRKVAEGGVGHRHRGRVAVAADGRAARVVADEGRLALNARYRAGVSPNADPKARVKCA